MEVGGKFVYTGKTQIEEVAEDLEDVIEETEAETCSGKDLDEQVSNDALNRY